MTRTAADIIADLGTGVHIDGRWRDAASGATFEVHNPATGEVVATVADGGPDDAAAAIEAAGRTQASWGAVPARERAEILRRAYELLIERADELALIMTTERGGGRGGGGPGPRVPPAVPGGGPAAPGAPPADPPTATPGCW